MTILIKSKGARGLSRFTLPRRTFLRGLAGSMLALPALDAMLNGNGDALAQGQPLPKRFGVWFWGNGVRLDRWNPAATGSVWELSPALAPLAPVKDYLNVVSNHEVHAAGPRGHHGGEAGMLSGVEFIPLEHPNSNYSSKFGGPSIDQLLVNDLYPDKPALAVGVSKRIVTSEGPTLQFISHRGPDNPIAPEYSPAALFTRMFGASFDPPDVNDPRAALRVSVLDAVRDETASLRARLGVNDKQRLDSHLTAISELRTRILALPPELTGACQLPETATTDENGDVDGNERLRDVNALMADLVVLSFACDLARSTSFMFTGSVGGTFFHEVPGVQSGHHDITHSGTDDAQDIVHGTTVYTMERFNDLLVRLRDTPEGAGNLLDQSLIMATSDCAEGLTHSNGDYPVVLAGRAGGAMRFPGVHHRPGETFGLKKNTNDILMTILQAMGSPRTSIGTGLTRSDTAISQVLA
jgi:hypothetical protein